MSKILIILSVVCVMFCEAAHARLLNVVGPMVIEDVLLYRDGGTIGIMIKDAQDQYVSFCIDFGMGSKTQGNIYYGATHPEDDDAQLILDEDFEQQLIDVVVAAINDYCAKDEQERIKATETADLKSLNQGDLKIYHAFQFLTLYEETEGLSYY